MNGGIQKSRAVEIYDPVSNAWTEGPMLPTPQTMTAALGYDGRIYALSNGDSVNYVYDPTGNAWQTLAATPAPLVRSSYALVAREHTLALVGGPGGGSLVTYDIDTNSFAAGPTYPLDSNVTPSEPYAQITAAAAMTPDGTLWMLGGFDAYTTDFVASSKTFKLVPNATVWEAGPALPTPFARATAITDTSGHILLFGGQSSAYLNSTHNYLPNTYAFDGTTWSPSPPIQDPRVAGGACVDAKGRVYYVGGEATPPGGNGSAIVGSVEIFTP
jgi:N-acetylneuraminic acid mutarotase